MKVRTENDRRVLEPRSPDEWRKWLHDHHDEEGVWLILYKKASGIKSVTYGQALDVALCYGWIDSRKDSRDDQSYIQHFGPRQAKSHWSLINKDKIMRLRRDGLLQPSGEAAVLAAQQNGSWNALDNVENLVVPPDLQARLNETPEALKHWNGFPKSVKKYLLYWVTSAKRPETRQKRIAETVEKASRNERANH